MSNVIGLQLTPNERRNYLFALGCYKGSYKLFRNSNDSWERKVAERDKEMYDMLLTKYVKGAT